MYNCTPLNKGTGKFDTEGFFDILNIQLNRQTIHFRESLNNRIHHFFIVIVYYIDQPIV